MAKIRPSKTPQFGEAMDRGQLALFAHGEDIQANVDPNPGDLMADGAGDVDKLWARKSEEAYDEGMTSSVRRQGVHTPVDIELTRDGFGVLRDGHHRVAAAADTNQWVPIDWDRY